MIKCISLTNPRVIEIYEGAAQKSRLVEESILFYSENKGKILTKEDMKQAVRECINGLEITAPVVELSEDNILEILNL